MHLAALVALGLVVAPGLAEASEDHGLFAISYEPSVPAGALARFVENPSFTGMRVEGRIRIAERLSFDLAGAWHYFYDVRGRQTLALRNGAVTGLIERSATSAAFMSGIHYTFGDADSGPVVPYVGVGVGPARFSTNTVVGDFAFGESRWGAVVSPDVGVRVQTSYGRHRPFGFLVAARSTHLTASFEDVQRPWYFGLQFGAYGSF
jgi:hypothetical protein